MGNIRLINQNQLNYTAVSNHFIEYYMPQANGEFVKVYLYLLRCLQTPSPECSVTVLADLLNHTENDILRAIRYWEKQGLLLPAYGEDGVISGLTFCSMQVDCASSDASPLPLLPASAGAPAAAVSAEAAESSPETSNLKISSPGTAGPNVPDAQTPPQYTPDEIAAFSEDPAMEELLYLIGRIMPHPLSTTDTNFILFWYDRLKFSTELIYYLVEYCISKDHSMMRYMNKVALAWKEEGIETVDQAKENFAAHSKAYYTVMKALGIYGRNLVTSETEYISRWTGSYGFSLEMIQEACSRTISATHQPSFEYTDSILSNWCKKGIHTLEDVKASDELFAQKKKTGKNKGGFHTGSADSAMREQPLGTRFNNFTQREYNEEELERMLLKTHPQD